MVSEMKRMLRTFGVSMQARNVELVADRCTFTGELLGCTRHGMFKRNLERTFHASAFEQPTQVLTNAAAAGFVDKLKGAQESQVVGRTGRFGTYHPWLKLEGRSSYVPVPLTTPESRGGRRLGFCGRGGFRSQRHQTRWRSTRGHLPRKLHGASHADKNTHYNRK